MKKLISIMLVLIIMISSVDIFSNVVYADQSINIDDIPRYYSGWYTGLTSFRKLKRSMDMHISNIEPDGNIIK